jgi:alpha-N-arabinofuranosidase
VGGTAARGAAGSVLTAAEMDAHNTFAAPDAVKPAPFQAAARDGRLVLSLPAKSVVVVAVQE